MEEGSKFIPQSVLLNEQQEDFANEVEIARKAKERLTEKMNKLRKEYNETIKANETAIAEAEFFAKNKELSKVAFYERLRKALMLLGAVMASLGVAVVQQPKILELFIENLYASLVALFGVFVSILSVLIGFFYSSAKEKTFVDIDDKLYTSRIEAVEREKDALLSRVKDLEFELANNVPGSGVGPVSSSESGDPEGFKMDHNSSVITSNSKAFDLYMKTLIGSLDKNIELADNKASLLLDKGTTYLWRGIMFYIASIVVWQVATSYFSVGQYAVWGMISCSMTFLVVEFLAAWFLRQYKSFTDSSFNLVRVKSVFNRYFLSYLAIKEFSDSSQHLIEMRGQMLKVLEEDIKWLEPVPQKAGDLNHMVAMFESVSGLVEKLKVSSKADSAAAS